MLEFPLQLEDNDKERFVSNNNDFEDMLPKLGLHHRFLSSYLCSSRSLMLIIIGRLICHRYPPPNSVNGRLNGKLISK